MGSDRISELPNSLLSQILSYLPTKVAATTDILSKRWRSVWLSVPTLHFDDDAVQDFHSFTNFMSSTISSRDSTLPISSFTFKCANQSSPYDLKDLNESVNFVVKQGRLETLNLHMPLESTHILSRDLVKIELAPSILTCKTLQVLNLSNIIMRDISPHYKFHLPLLKTLHWRGVLYDSTDYPIKLLSSCPVLHELHAYYSRLIHFLIEDYSPTTKVLPITNLHKARICDLNVPITMLSQVQNLHLDTGRSLDDQLPIFNRLTDIDLIYKIGGNIPHISKVLWWIQLLKCCPQLLNITIQDCVIGDPFDSFDRYLNEQPIVPQCLSSHLKTFCVRDYKGSESEIQFATYIIQNSKVLEIITITSDSSMNINEKSQILKKLSSSKRGSPACQLLFD
ncbi:hypothetical protein RYX36_016916 [Vicia faba]